MSQQAPCPVCESPAKKQDGVGDFARYDCPRCGTFAPNRSAEAELEGMLAAQPLRRSLMSHTIRRSQSTTTNRVLRLSTYDLPSYWSAERLPTPQQQADNMVMWCGDHQPQPELAAHGALPEIAAWIGTAISAFPGRAGIDWLNGELKEEFYQMWGDPLNMSVKLTMKGWAKYEELKKRDIDSRVAFMAMKFGDASLNRVVEECFRPAVDRTGFRLRFRPCENVLYFPKTARSRA